MSTPPSPSLSDDVAHMKYKSQYLQAFNESFTDAKILSLSDEGQLATITALAIKDNRIYVGTDVGDLIYYATNKYKNPETKESSSYPSQTNPKTIAFDTTRKCAVVVNDKPIQQISYIQGSNFAYLAVLCNGVLALHDPNTLAIYHLIQDSKEMTQFCHVETPSYVGFLGLAGTYLYVHYLPPMPTTDIEHPTFQDIAEFHAPMIAKTANVLRLPEPPHCLAWLPEYICFGILGEYITIRQYTGESKTLQKTNGATPMLHALPNEEFLVHTEGKLISIDSRRLGRTETRFSDDNLHLIGQFQPLSGSHKTATLFPFVYMFDNHGHMSVRNLVDSSFEECTNLKVNKVTGVASDKSTCIFTDGVTVFGVVPRVYVKPYMPPKLFTKEDKQKRVDYLLSRFNSPSDPFYGLLVLYRDQFIAEFPHIQLDQFEMAKKRANAYIHKLLATVMWSLPEFDDPRNYEPFYASVHVIFMEHIHGLMMAFIRLSMAARDEAYHEKMNVLREADWDDLGVRPKFWLNERSLEGEVEEETQLKRSTDAEGVVGECNQYHHDDLLEWVLDGKVTLRCVDDELWIQRDDGTSEVFHFAYNMSFEEDSNSVNWTSNQNQTFKIEFILPDRYQLFKSLYQHHGNRDSVRYDSDITSHYNSLSMSYTTMLPSDSMSMSYTSVTPSVADVFDSQMKMRTNLSSSSLSAEVDNFLAEQRKRSPYHEAIHIVKRIEKCKSPRRKAEHVVKSIDSVIKTINSFWKQYGKEVVVYVVFPHQNSQYSGADDLVPIYAHVLIKANINRLYSEMAYIDVLGPTYRGKMSYCLATFQTVIENLEYIAVAPKWTADDVVFLDTPTPSETEIVKPIPHIDVPERKVALGAEIMKKAEEMTERKEHELEKNALDLDLLDDFVDVELGFDPREFKKTFEFINPNEVLTWFNCMLHRELLRYTPIHFYITPSAFCLENQQGSDHTFKRILYFSEMETVEKAWGHIAGSSIEIKMRNGDKFFMKGFVERNLAFQQMQECLTQYRKLQDMGTGK